MSSKFFLLEVNCGVEGDDLAPSSAAVNLNSEFTRRVVELQSLIEEKGLHYVSFFFYESRWYEDEPTDKVRDDEEEIRMEDKQCIVFPHKIVFRGYVKHTNWLCSTDGIKFEELPSYTEVIENLKF